MISASNRELGALCTSNSQADAGRSGEAGQDHQRRGPARTITARLWQHIGRLIEIGEFVASVAAIHGGIEATADGHDVRVVAVAVDVLPCDRERHALCGRAIRAPEAGVRDVDGAEVEVGTEGGERVRVGAVGAVRVDVHH